MILTAQERRKMWQEWHDYRYVIATSHIELYKTWMWRRPNTFDKLLTFSLGLVGRKLPTNWYARKNNWWKD